MQYLPATSPVMRVLPGLAIILSACCAGPAREDDKVRGILFDLWRNVAGGAVATLARLPAYPGAKAKPIRLHQGNLDGGEVFSLLASPNNLWKEGIHDDRTNTSHAQKCRRRR